VGKWILCFSLAIPLSAGSIYWSSPSAAPIVLGLDTVLSVDDSGVAVGAADGQAVAVLAPMDAVFLGAPSGSAFSIATAINGNGQAAGVYQDQSGYDYAFFWSAPSGVVPLGTLGGPLSIPTAINGAGQIVGQSLDGDGAISAFLWSPGAGMSQIGDAASEMATGINDLGEIAYLERPSPYTSYYGAVGSLSSPSILDFGGQGSYIASINDAGWIAGRTSGGDGFLWTPSGLVDFGSAFVPGDVNNAGEVLGCYRGQPAVWTADGGFQFLDVAGYGGVIATHISDNGQIVGNASPVPEPPALVLCLVGALLLSAGWLRRGSS